MQTLQEIMPGGGRTTETRGSMHKKTTSWPTPQAPAKKRCLPKVRSIPWDNQRQSEATYGSMHRGRTTERMRDSSLIEEYWRQLLTSDISRIYNYYHYLATTTRPLDQDTYTRYMKLKLHQSITNSLTKYHCITLTNWLTNQPTN